MKTQGEQEEVWAAGNNSYWMTSVQCFAVILLIINKLSPVLFTRTVLVNIRKITVLPRHEEYSIKA